MLRLSLDDLLALRKVRNQRGTDPHLLSCTSRAVPSKSGSRHTIPREMPMLIASRTRRAAALIGSAAMLAVAGCGDDSSDDTADTASTPAASAIAAPAAIKDAGEILFCSDVAYPPMEFYEGKDPQGADIDIANELSSRLGVKAEYANTGFDGIIAALQAKKCDAIISSLTNSPERAKEIDFVDYAQFGLAVLIHKGGADITTNDDLAGKNVAVQVGTTTKQTLEGISKELEAAGKPAIKVTSFPKDTDAANALRTDKVDAYITDSPPAAYFVKQAPNDFQLASLPQIDAAPVGIGLRKDEIELKTALKTGIDQMTEDGKLEEILKKWELGDALLSKQ